MLDQGGPERLKQLPRVRSSEFETRFQQVYGRALDEAERDWRAFCAAYRPWPGQRLSGLSEV
jgi:hypothetical protein